MRGYVGRGRRPDLAVRRLSDAEADGLVRRAVSQLGEHFDTVHVLVTVHDGGATRAFNVGFGNWYARMGQMGEVLARNDEEQREYVRCVAEGGDDAAV